MPTPTLITSEAVWTLGVSEARTFTFDFTNWLVTGVTLSAVSGSNAYSVTLGVAEITTSALTIGTPEITTGSVTVMGGSGEETIATGKAVQVLIRAASATAGKSYEIRCRATTSAGDTLEMRQIVQVV